MKTGHPASHPDSSSPVLNGMRSWMGDDLILCQKRIYITDGCGWKCALWSCNSTQQCVTSSWSAPVNHCSGDRQFDSGGQQKQDFQRGAKLTFKPMKRLWQWDNNLLQTGWETCPNYHHWSGEFSLIPTHSSDPQRTCYPRFLSVLLACASVLLSGLFGDPVPPPASLPVFTLWSHPQGQITAKPTCGLS